MDKRGTVMLELGPQPGNPRNSEGAFLATREGLLFVYSRFIGGSARDHTPADIAAISSTDGGRSFSAPRVLFRARDFGAMNVMSVSLLRMRTGQIGLFFLIRKSFQDMQPHLALSDDEGQTFGPPRCLTQRTAYFVMNNDRVIRLPGGRILLPLAEHVPLKRQEQVPPFHPGSLTCLYSDDDGRSFQESVTPLYLMNRNSQSGLQEPGLISLGGNWVYGWARTDLGCQYEMLSRDGGETWTMPQPSGFTSPLSPLSMKALPDGRFFALWNPVPSYQTRQVDPRTGGRTPLVYALSQDQGLSWSRPVVLEDNPAGGYCYAAIHVDEEALFLAYCAGAIGTDPSCLDRIRIRRLPLSDLVDQAGQPGPEGAMGIGLKEPEVG